jgi:hypothetical protein
MKLIKITQDTTTLVEDLFPLFKEHLRILHDVEDETIKLYLGAAIDGIGTFSSNEIFLTEFEVFYPYDDTDIRYPSSYDGWYCGKWFTSDLTIYNAAGIDITGDYTIDNEHGMVYPHPRGNKVSFKVGFSSGDEVPYHMKTIIFRYGAHLFENRESVRIGEPKIIPDWVNYVLASIWKPRV